MRQYVWVPVALYNKFAHIMPSLSESSSEEEQIIESVNPNVQEEITVDDSVVESTAQTPSKAVAPMTVESVLDKVLSALLFSPDVDAKKGLSIVKVKDYLKREFRVKAAEMKQWLKPAIEVGVDRDILEKTSGRYLMLGSIRVTEAYSLRKNKVSQSRQPMRTEEDTSAQSESDEQPLENVSRKRKGTDDESGRAPPKRRLGAQRHI